MRDTESRSPAVSVVIPVKDDAPRLRACLEALARQTCPPEEIVVVDNGSRDDSAQVARDRGARVVRCDQPGIPAAATTGYDAARGDLILRLDADSLPGPAWVRAYVDAFARRQDVAAFTSGARFHDGPRAIRGILARAYLLAYAAASLTALGHLPVFGSNFAMRAAAWRGIRIEVHRDDPELHDDLDLSFHLGARHRIRYLPGARVGISMRPFFSARLFRRRVARGFRTVFAHWPADLPPVRWARLARTRRLRADPQIPGASGSVD